MYTYTKLFETVRGQGFINLFDGQFNTPLPRCYTFSIINCVAQVKIKTISTELC